MKYTNLDKVPFNAIIIIFNKKATLFAYPSVLKVLMRAYAVSDLSSAAEKQLL